MNELKPKPLGFDDVRVARQLCRDADRWGAEHMLDRKHGVNVRLTSVPGQSLTVSCCICGETATFFAQDPDA